jgi:hypothetical protein
MLKSTLLGLVFLVVASALEAGQATIDSFKAEAEASLNAQIEITDSIAPGGDMGETYCQVRPVAIRLEANLPAELREAVLSHESGHARLCARGIYILDARDSALSLTRPAVARDCSYAHSSNRTHFFVGARIASVSGASVHLRSP